VTKRPVLLQVILIALSAALFQSTFDIVYFRLGAVRAAETMAVVDWSVANLAQALGMAAIGLAMWRLPELIKSQRILLPVVAVSLLSLVGLYFAASPAAMLSVGVILLLANGVITGDTLISVARSESRAYYGRIAGFGLALGMVGEYVAVGIIGRGTATGGLFIFTAALIVTTTMASRLVGSNAESVAQSYGSSTNPLTGKPIRKIVLATCAVAALVFMIALLGIYRPRLVIPDLMDRLAFMQGLLVFGALAIGPVLDWSRRSGAVIMMSSLMLALVSVTFVNYAIEGTGTVIALSASLGYALLGGAVVFVMVAFFDISSSARALLPLAVAGLAIRSTIEAVVMVVPDGLMTNPLAASLLLSSLLAPAVSFFVVVLGYLYSLNPPESLFHSPQPLTPEDRTQAFSVKHNLSLREREILELLLDKKSNPQIAAELFISENTAKFHVRNILKKSGCSSRTDVYDCVWAENGDGASYSPVSAAIQSE